MNRPDDILLRCRRCGHREVVGPVEMMDHLRQLGMFKRQREPDWQLVFELYSAQIPLLRCHSCGEPGYDPDAVDAWDDEQWGAARKCDACHAEIPLERLEVFPDTRLCVKCQQSIDNGQDAGDPEYCPRCGAIMKLSQRGGAGLTGYVMRCPDCQYRG